MADNLAKIQLIGEFVAHARSSKGTALDLEIAQLLLAEQRRAPPPAVEGGWRDVLAERERQKTVKGWTSEHDDDHDNGELVHAEWGAMGRLKQAASLIGLYSPVPAEARKLLVESAALILAEVERIDRATVSTDLREPWRDFRSYSTNERLLAEFKWTDGRVAVGQWSAHGYWMRHVGGTMRQETINRKFETVTYDVMTVVLAKAPDGVYPTDWRPLPIPPAGEKPEGDARPLLSHPADVEDARKENEK